MALTVRDAAGTTAAAVRSDDPALKGPKRPGTQPGLNRFVWDLKYPGPVSLDPALAAAKTKPLASEPDGQPGPAAPPGEYEVELSVGPETQSARFTIAGDPRLGTTPEEYASQFALLQQLTQSLSRLNEAVEPHPPHQAPAGRARGPCRWRPGGPGQGRDGTPWKRSKPCWWM